MCSFRLICEAEEIPIMTGSSSLDSRSQFITVMVMTICTKSRSQINQRHPTLWSTRNHLHRHLHAIIWA